jgi:cyanate permease
MVGIMLIFSIPSRFFTGLFADRVSKSRMKIMLAIPFGFLCIGIAAYLIHPSIRTTYILLLLYGIAHGLPTPLILICISRYFGRKAFGAISGTTVMFIAPAAFIAPILTGWIFDATASYAAALMIFSTISLVIVIVLSFLKPPEK